MKNLIYSLCVLFTSQISSAQLADTTMTKYRTAKATKAKMEALFDNFKLTSSADSIEIAKAVKLEKWFRKEKDHVGADYTNLYIAGVFAFKGDYNTTLSLAFPTLAHFQKRHDQYGMMRANHIIGLAYSQAKNYESSNKYMKKAVVLAERIDPNGFLSTAYNDLAVDYSVAKMPDSGLVYAQKAVTLDKAGNTPIRLGTSLSTIGENHMAAGDYEIALPFLRKSMRIFKSVKGGNDGYMETYLYNDFAQAFLGLKQHDSMRYYAKKSVGISKKFGFKDQLLRSYEYLYASFESTHTQDSVFKYYRLAMNAKDEMFSIEKMRNLETMKFREQIRQQQLEANALEAEEERRNTIQFALIATGIISFFILFLLLSRTVVVNEKWISFLAILALLLVFEFVNLLIHPFIGNLTHHSPVLMLLCMVLLASLLIPMHHKLEHLIKHKLTEKNKAIRLAAAKKTIEQLQNQSDNT